ncbi:cholesterol oxidase, partial [Streptomyces verrucosisporus]|nr:cholesterol oxidase [Streptomyces verrucosisporus]
AMSLWPNKGEADPRPEQGADYVRVPVVPPRAPAVPEDAFAALRLPVVLPVPAVPPKRTAPEAETAETTETAESAGAAEV